MIATLMHGEWEGERPREPLRVRAFLTTGSRGRLPSLFFTVSGARSEARKDSPLTKGAAA